MQFNVRYRDWVENIPLSVFLSVRLSARPSVCRTVVITWYKADFGISIQCTTEIDVRITEVSRKLSYENKKKPVSLFTIIWLLSRTSSFRTCVSNPFDNWFNKICPCLSSLPVSLLIVPVHTNLFGLFTCSWWVSVYPSAFVLLMNQIDKLLTNLWKKIQY